MAEGNIYYVEHGHVNANDNNTGLDPQQPWRTLVHAGTQITYGDTCIIKAGEPYNDGDVLITQSGGTFKAYPGPKPVLRGVGILGVGVSDVTIDGLRLVLTPSKAIRFEGRADPGDPPASGIVIRNCHTYFSHSSALSIWGIDGDFHVSGETGMTDVLLEHNLLEFGTTGGSNEIITVANGVENCTVRYNEIRRGDPAMTGGDEGIDFKRGVRNSSIYGNLVWDLSDKAIYIDAGEDFSNDPPHGGPSGPPALTENILIYNNRMFDLPSAGIVITSEGAGNVRDVTVFNNIAYDCTGDGFRVYDHEDGEAARNQNPAWGNTSDVLFINNTAYNCGSDHGGGFRVNHPVATGIVFRNNIGWNNVDYDFRGESGTVFEFNLGREAWLAFNDDPLFLSEAKRRFQLRNGSPALNVGSPVGAPAFDFEWKPRPDPTTGLVDLGAYEKQ
jgi:hypothetical protein